MAQFFKGIFGRLTPSRLASAGVAPSQAEAGCSSRAAIRSAFPQRRDEAVLPARELRAREAERSLGVAASSARGRERRQRRHRQRRVVPEARLAGEVDRHQDAREPAMTGSAFGARLAQRRALMALELRHAASRPLRGFARRGKIGMRCGRLSGSSRRSRRIRRGRAPVERQDLGVGDAQAPRAGRP